MYLNGWNKKEIDESKHKEERDKGADVEAEESEKEEEEEEKEIRKFLQQHRRTRPGFRVPPFLPHQ